MADVTTNAAEQARMQQSVGKAGSPTGPGGQMILTADSPEVKTELEARPELTVDAAMGNVLNEFNKKYGASVATSDAAAKKTEANQAELDAIAERTARATESAKKAGIIDTPAVPGAEKGEIDLIDDQMEAESASVLGQLDAMATTMDDQSKAMIESIKASYERRKQQQAIINQNALAGQTKLGVRAGRQRYAAEVQTGILAAEESAGIARLADLDAEEQRLILEAQMANTEKQFSVLNAKMDEIRSVRREKTDLLMEQYRLGTEQERLAIEKARAAREATRFGRQEEEATAENIAGTIFGALTGDEAIDQQTILDASVQYNIDPNVLLNTVNEYQIGKEKNDLEATQLYQSIAKDIPEGETFVSPSGLVFIGQKDPENIEVVQTIGNTEYQVRYRMGTDGELEEVFRIELGPRWKGGSGGAGTTTTSAGKAMNMAIADLQALKKKGELTDLTYDVWVNALVEEYGSDYDTVSSEVNQRLEAVDTGRPLSEIKQKAEVEKTVQNIEKKAEASGNTLFMQQVQNELLKQTDKEEAGDKKESTKKLTIL